MPDPAITSPVSTDVEVYALNVDDPPRPPDDLAQCLSPDELHRVDRFADHEDRARAILARAAIRMLLGERLEVPPQSLRFRYGQHGKPFLDAEFGSFPFSISHSGGWVLVAIATHGAVGVDIERFRPVRRLRRIAERYFLPDEADAILRLPERHRLPVFFRFWTWKEACLKATGGGVSQGLDRFHISIAESDPRVLNVGGSITEAMRWTLWSAKPADGYTAALAIDVPDARITSRFWTGSAGLSDWRVASQSLASD